VKLYRYESHTQVDSFNHCTAVLKLEEFEVVKETAKGHVIEDYGLKRFVLLNAVKHYACTTKEEALQSFIARKKKEIEIYKTKLLKAETALGEAIFIQSRMNPQ